MDGVTGLEEIDEALSRLPDQVQKELTRQLTEFADGEVDRIQAAARKVSRQAALAAHGVTAGHNSTGGTISAGGSQSLPTGTGTFGDLFYGAEFGGGSRPETRQFLPYKPQGYWFFNQLSDDEHRLEELIAKAVDAAIGEA